MKMKEYIDKNGIKIKFLAESIGIARSTLYQIILGDSVSAEVADKVKQVCGKHIEIPVIKTNKGHVRNRRKKDSNCMFV